MKIVIFGTGLYYKNRKQTLDGKVEIVAFLDNDIAKEGKILDGAEIMLPLKITTLQYDRVLLMSKEANHAEMTQQLLDLGVKKDKIIGYDALKCLLSAAGSVEMESAAERIQKISIACKSGKDIFILYDKLKELIKAEKNVSQEEQDGFKQACKEKLISGMNGIFLEHFWN